MTPQERQQLNDLQAWKQSMESAATIPLSVDQAFKARFSIVPVTTSAKSATSESQAVNESGSASYGVLSNPNGFLQLTIGSSIYYIPYFT